MKHVRAWWPFTLLIFGWGINAIIWAPQLTYVKYAHNNWTMVGIQLLHSGTIIVFLTVLLTIGAVLARQTFSLARTVKFWLYTILTASLAVIVDWLVFNQFNYHRLYNALLPISRNAAPLATAVIIASGTLPWLRTKTSKHSASTGITLLALPLAATSLFNQDMFGLLKGNSVAFYLLILTIGALADQLTVNRRRTIKWLSAALIINILLVAVMPNAAFQTHASMVTAGRFTTPTFLPTVIIAGCTFTLFSKQLTPFVAALDYPGYFLTGLAVLFSDPVVISRAAKLTSLTANFAGQIGIILFLALLGMAIGLILPSPVNGLQARWQLSRRINRCLATATDQTTDQQLSTITRRVTRAIGHRWPSLLAFLVAYVLADLSIYYMGNDTIFVKQSMLWLTTLLIFLTFKALQALTNRYWLSLLVTGMSNIIWIIANIQKMNLRNEPILPSELAMIDDLDSLLKMIDYHLLIYSGIAIVVVIVAIVVLEHRYRAQRLTWPWRIFWLILAVCAFGSSAFWNHHGSRMQTIMAGLDDQPHFIHQAVGAKQNGPTVQFLNNVDITVMTRPHGYSKAAMERISREYNQTARQINATRTDQLKDQTIIFNLSESFANPDRVPGVTLKANPIPRIDHIKKQTTSGIMISSGYGGGTADMEYMSLTGFAMCNFAQTLSTPYTQLVPYLKHNPTIVQSFKYAAAIHPYSKKFYDRGTDYPKFGFKKFSYLGSKQYPIRHQKKIDRNTYMSDQTAYANTLDQLKAHHGAQFINLVTMQNHLPYNNLYNRINRFHATVGDGTDPAQVENYAMGIHYTDAAVDHFIKEISKLNRPITLVFYGDHLPGIYRNSMKKDGLKLHETDYFIYSNPAAQRQGARKLTRSTHYVGPNDFIAMAAEQTNSRVTPYQALLTRLYHELPAYALSTQQNGTNSFNSAPEYVNQQGKVVNYNSFTKKQKKLWHDYQLVQYDITAGHHYLLKTNMMK
ncbi:LTA synthase family protein [Limosilactobacillus pontis]|uniref:LTA synthase family protein n=1 Tax=Limosilactobacillus pontis TaxID=35787 RepID=UPI0025A41371|nr:LTA synthase family protein [Limosilactobacillus pontis]MDM8332168.1 LTA synthase family protein [Limosilactobacillus pontis]